MKTQSKIFLLTIKPNHMFTKMLQLFSAIYLMGSIQSKAQLTFPVEGGSRKAEVRERIAITDVTVIYNRPGVKGREGKIWGDIVHKGFKDLEFGTSRSSPWRSGANESTTIEFTTDVAIQGKKVPAGKYGLFIAFDPTESTLILSRNSTAWGSFSYNPKDDILRVAAKPVMLDKNVEWLKYEFTDQTESGATLSVMWERLAIPFRIEVDVIETQLTSLRRELETEKGFGWKAWQTAAQWASDHNASLGEALQWATKASGTNFPGERNFLTLATKAEILEKLGRKDESVSTFKEALPLGSMGQIHSYARHLLALKRNQEALSFFKENLEKYPNQYMPVLGVARGYSAVGDYKKAVEYLEKALPLSPNQANKLNLERMLGLARQGNDINQ